MKSKFLKYFLIVLISVVIYVVYASIFAGPKTDAFYNRFTSSKQNSLILGSSRAAQGIDPSQFDSLGLQGLFNFSFTLVNSSFGEVYLNAIKEKLNLDYSGHRVFIIEVTPFSISKFETESDENNERTWREKNSFLEKLAFFNLDPNIDYLLRCYTSPNYLLYLTDKNNKTTYLFDNGWLKIEVPMDTESFENRKKKYLVTHNKKTSSDRHLSKKRLDYLNQTVAYLKDLGLVLIVRLPMDKDIYAEEQKYMPEFDSLMVNLAQSNNVKYIDFTFLNEQVLTTDGAHMYYKSGQFFSSILSDTVSKNLYK